MILSGSHIDTVVNGGNLDGQFGIEAAFMAIKHLKDTYGPPLRSLEVIALAEEEGSRFPYVFWGSKNIVGLARREDVQHITDAKGVGFVNAMRDAGFDFPAASATAQRHRGLRRDPYRTGQGAGNRRQNHRRGDQHRRPTAL